jgi:hypothetical protein
VPQKKAIVVLYLQTVGRYVWENHWFNATNQSELTNKNYKAAKKHGALRLQLP